MAFVAVDKEMVRRHVERAASVGILACASIVAESARASMTKGGRIGSRHYSPSAPGSPPAVQSGHLRRSITARNTSAYTAVAGTRVPYGRHLEYGAVIRPRKGRYLAVPVSTEARRAAAGGRSARTVPGLKVITPRGKDPLLVRPRGKDAFDVMYALRRESRIAARPWLAPAMYRVRGSLQSVFVGAARRVLATSLGVAGGVR